MPCEVGRRGHCLCRVRSAVKSLAQGALVPDAVERGQAQKMRADVAERGQAQDALIPDAVEKGQVQDPFDSRCGWEGPEARRDDATCS